MSAVDAATITAAQTNDATSAPGAIMGAGGMAAAMLVASNMISSGAQASVSFAAGAGTVTATGAVAVTAADTAAITASTAQYAEVSPTNDAGAGILNRFADAITRDYAFTQQSGTQPVKFGDLVRADDGTVYRYMGVDATLDLGAQDYADYGRWKALEPANLITDAVAYAALNAIGTALGVDDLAGTADAYFGLVDTNYVKSVVSASISHVALTAGGDVTVSATEAASISASDDSYVATWAGKGGLIVTNVVVADATASVTDGSLAGAAIAVTASTTATIDATVDDEDRGLRQVPRVRGGLQHDRLEAVEPAVQPRRRDPRRSAHVDRVQRRRHPVGRARLHPRHDRDRDRRAHRRRHAGREADRDGRQRGPRRCRPRRGADDRLADERPRRRRPAGLQQGQHRRPRPRSRSPAPPARCRPAERSP